MCNNLSAGLAPFLPCCDMAQGDQSHPLGTERQQKRGSKKVLRVRPAGLLTLQLPNVKHRHIPAIKHALFLSQIPSLQETEAQCATAAHEAPA